MITCTSALRLAAPTALLILLLSLPAGAASQTGTVESPRNGTPPAEVKPKAARPSPQDICRAMTRAAAGNGLPVDFFVRLIWQESRFNPNAVSPKGAMGIAQFMPGTASGRGLSDPFDPMEALNESASYLRELRTTFGGSLGLAAAAYNAGPGRVEAWLAGTRSLPAETEAYVQTVTGHAAGAWASPEPPQWPSFGTRGDTGCLELARLMVVTPRPAQRPALGPAWGPWGVQLAGNWSEGGVLASYERLRRTYRAALSDRLPLVLRAKRPGRRAATRYIVRVSEKTRTGADALCEKLRAAGGACIVLRNPGREPGQPERTP